MSPLKSQMKSAVRELAVNSEPITSTQIYDKKTVFMELGACEINQETMALLQLLSLGQMDLSEGRFQSASDFFAEMDAED